MDVKARSSTKGSRDSSDAGSVASSTLASACATLVLTNADESAATASTASRGVADPWTRRWATRAKNSPPSSALASRCVNMAARAAVARSSSRS